MKLKEFLHKEIRFLKGVGPAKDRLFNKLGLKTVEDILNHKPFRYDDMSNITLIRDCTEDTYSLFFLRITDIRSINTRQYKVLKIRACDSSGYCDITFFNQDFLKKFFYIGKSYYFYGKAKKELFNLILNSPDFFSQKDFSGGIFPVYNLTQGLSLSYFRKISGNLIRELQDINVKEILPDMLVQKYDMQSWKTSISNMHFPENPHKADKAIEDLKFREIFSVHLAFRIMKEEKNRKNHYTWTENFDLDDFESLLPFSLTSDQRNSITDIQQKLLSGYNINILLQGDVGAGKTVVALYFMIKAYLSGYKSVIMAPTEVLASQHVKSMSKFTQSLNLRIIFIKGGNYKGKKEQLKSLEDEEPAIVIGTHALFQKDVNFSDTSIVIIDEQHRFGVMQRMELSRKTGCGNLIVMSATPIPRTLSMTVYGDMDFCVIKEKPAERIKIRTYVRNESSLPKIYDFISGRVGKGEKCFIITPLVDESDKLELKSAISVYEELSSGVFRDFNIGILHGRMKDIEKEEIMNKLKSGEINILVSTTVIEVGVDIPDATVIVINHAERFGIAQLHQLRGRVGRGKLASWCILVHSDNISLSGKKRLGILERSDDGFYLAEKDLELRGSGELLGARQHGFGTFLYVEPQEDRILIEKVKKEVNAFLEINRIHNIDEKLLEYIKEKYLDNYSII